MKETDEPVPAGAFERIGNARPFTVVVNITIVEETPQAAVDAVGLMVRDASLALKHGARVSTTIVGCQPEWVRPFATYINGNEVPGQHYAIGAALRALADAAAAGGYSLRATGEVRDSLGGVVLTYSVKQLRGMSG